MKKYLVGILVGFLCTTLVIVSVLETIHIEVEKRSALSFCGYLLDSTGRIYGEEFQNFIKITYKVFAKPVKTILIYGVAKNARVMGINAKQ